MEIEKVDKDKEEEMKKQIRRVHSSKPYKERLMNMAEARREIATALKFHRASMKQQQQEAATATANHHQLQTHPPSQQLFTNNYSIPHHYPISTIVPPPPLNHHEHLNLALPNQTLGLNLNFQDFNNLNTTVYHTPMSVATKEVAAIEIEPEKVIKPADSNHEDDDDDDDDDDDGYHPFEQVMEFPPWLINANECPCLQEELSDEYSPDPALPWMDIGEIEGMDGEWLA